MTEKAVKIKFEPMGRRMDGRLNETITTVAARGNLPIRSDCGGAGKCGKCLVMVSPAASVTAPTRAEIDIPGTGKLAENIRLACQAKILGPLTVTIPERFMDVAGAQGKELAEAVYSVNPMVRRVFVPKTGFPSGKDSTGDIVDWFTGRLRDACGADPAIPDHLLRRISPPDILRGDATAVVHEVHGVTSIVEGNAPRSLGLGVDIGTTTVAVYLCDMQSGRVVASRASANPQRRFGEDVISRIGHAGRDAGNVEVLQKLLADEISELARQCVEEVSALLRDIDEVSIVGNTTMEQLFYGAHPYSLGTAPFLPLTRDPVRLAAREVGLSLNPGTPVYVFPVVSGFVGGDTLGAVLADKPYRREEMSLIVDIGTNGELVMGNREKLWAASCATGPAFEGAQISCGMRAVRGAVSRLDLDAATGKVSYELIGEGPGLRPMGLCGSGIIDAIAALRRAGIILESGSFRADAPGVVYDEKGIGREFVLVPKEESGTGSPISITLGDIRQIQLAKAALAVGILYLTERAQKAADRIVLTGAFGARFDWHNAVDIGMLPKEAVSGSVLPMDNLAGVGAILALLDGRARSEIEGVCRNVRHVDLAHEPDFHKRLMKQISFPPLG